MDMILFDIYIVCVIMFFVLFVGYAFWKGEGKSGEEKDEIY